VKQHTRKPFVAPQLKEEASLAGITLISGCRTGHQRKGKKNFGYNTRRGHSSRRS
jgi:hypothetical protein